MKITTTLTLTLTLFILTARGNSNNSPGQTNDAQEKTNIPKVDLHSAVVTDNFEVIRQHIESGSDLNLLEPSRESTPLITAAAFGKTETAKMLIEAGADLNYQNVDGSTALITASVFGTTGIAKLLIDSGAELDTQNNDGSAALHTAAFFGHTGIVKALIENGADKTLKNRTGQTPLEIVLVPFEDIKPVYDAIGASLKPLGVRLDYEKIKAARPQIAELLK